MREFLEAIAGVFIIATLIFFSVYVGKKLFSSDEAENYEKQIDCRE